METSAEIVPPRTDATGWPGAESELLLSHLRVQRQHVLGILDGLAEDDLHRPLLPSGWSCLGLVQHLALDVERFWFRAVVAGERGVIEELSEVLLHVITETACHAGHPDAARELIDGRRWMVLT